MAYHCLINTVSVCMTKNKKIRYSVQKSVQSSVQKVQITTSNCVKVGTVCKWWKSCALLRKQHKVVEKRLKLTVSGAEGYPHQACTSNVVERRAVSSAECSFEASSNIKLIFSAWNEPKNCPR
jgi:hypothetical protein